MDNDKKLFEELLKADGINPTGPTESERIAFAGLLDQHSKPKKSKPTSQPNTWRIIMKSKMTKSATAAAVLILIIIGMYNLIGSGTSVAFANAIEYFVAVQTARFDLSIEFGEQEPQISTFLYNANGYIKQNMANGDINILDYNQGKVLSLEPETMTAELRDIKNGSFHSALQEIFVKFHDMITEAMNLAVGKVLSLGTAIINNREAYGYQIETTVQKPGLYWQGKGTLTIWADAETDFPFELQWYSEMTNIRVTVSNIGLNIYIDPAQFSMDIPEGYNLPALPEPVAPAAEPNDLSVQEADVIEIEKIPDPNLAELLEGLNETEQAMIKFFHSWTALTKGRFPSSLSTDAIKDIDPDAEISFKQKLWSFSSSISLPNLFGDWKPDVDPNDYSEQDRQQLKKQRGPIYEELQRQFDERFDTIKPHFNNIGDGFGIVYKMPAKSDWHYNGAGVEIGDSDTAIFWYKPRDSDSYRAIYGNLTIADVAPENLHLLENPSDEEIDQNANDLLETAIQLGADIPKDERATVLRMLSLKEKDLIKGLATYLEFSNGTYPPTLNFDKAFVKHLDGFLAEAYKNQQIDEKQGKAKTLDIGFAAFFYDKLVRENKDPAYYGDTITVNDTDKILVRWKTSKNRYRVIYGSLKAETVTTEKLAELEKASIPTR